MLAHTPPPPPQPPSQLQSPLPLQPQSPSQLQSQLPLPLSLPLPSGLPVLLPFSRQSQVLPQLSLQSQLPSRLPFVVIPSERSDEGSLFQPHFHRPPANQQRPLGGRSFSSDITISARSATSRGVFPASSRNLSSLSNPSIAIHDPTTMSPQQGPVTQ
jgi:hypothetical protein